MWEKIRVVWQIPELRRKILLTLGLLAVYRLGFQIPLPIVDPAKVAAFNESSSGIASVLKQVAVFSASQLSQITIFGLGIMPYISASIIFQLLASVYPPLERLQKEGEAGRKKINEYTRYATVAICLIQSWMYVSTFVANPAYGFVESAYLNEAGQLTFGWTVVAVLTMTAGTIFLMWIGEQIDEFGIGNGISLLIMAGILSDMPGAGTDRRRRRAGHRATAAAGPDVRGGGRGRGLHHAGPAPHSYAERQARSRPPRDGGRQAVSAAEG
ncbi:MAG TPA: hypothetical protein PJ982_04045 [Lacipirellulaceae bacterium]|nr:hypothetical protein [Lacipirellulaceae bacterium]